MTEKYDRIGKQYNTTRKTDPYLLSRMQHLLAPASGKSYLDIGCGTGNYTIPMASKGAKFIGVDPSDQMLQQAVAKSATFVEWRKGHSEATGLDEHSVDGILASLTLHHWPDLAKAMTEQYRVLKAGGAMVIFTSTKSQMEGYWLRHYFPQMLHDSIEQMPAFAEIQSALTQAGFTITEIEKYFIQADLQDQFLYCGKHQPTLYLDPAIRNGISSFSDLSRKEEVQQGLAKLEADIRDGSIQAIIQEFENDKGDYLFIRAKK